MRRKVERGLYLGVAVAGLAVVGLWIGTMWTDGYLTAPQLFAFAVMVIAGLYFRAALQHPAARRHPLHAVLFHAIPAALVLVLGYGIFSDHSILGSIPMQLGSGALLVVLGAVERHFPGGRQKREQ